jgi:hypothetical protein
MSTPQIPKYTQTTSKKPYTKKPTPKTQNQHTEANSMKSIRISLQEERTDDAWFDLSLRELRAGEVRFYKANDLQTGQWLFKICVDQENSRSMVKAIKCPPGKLFSQLEGATMLFQQSLSPDLYYDIISLTKVDGEGKVHREVLKTSKKSSAHYAITTKSKTTMKPQAKNSPEPTLLP